MWVCVCGCVVYAVGRGVLTCLRGALPPVDLRAVCLVRAMLTGRKRWGELNVVHKWSHNPPTQGRPNPLTPLPETPQVLFRSVFAVLGECAVDFLSRHSVIASCTRTFTDRSALNVARTMRNTRKQSHVDGVTFGASVRRVPHRHGSAVCSECTGCSAMAEQCVGRRVGGAAVWGRCRGGDVGCSAAVFLCDGCVVLLHSLPLGRACASRRHTTSVRR